MFNGCFSIAFSVVYFSRFVSGFFSWPFGLCKIPKVNKNHRNHQSTPVGRSLLRTSLPFGAQLHLIGSETVLGVALKEEVADPRVKHLL